MPSPLSPRRRAGRAVGAALVAALLAAPAACGPRTVNVSTGEVASGGATLTVTNNLEQAINLYVRPAGGNEIFVRQVPARATETVPVRGLGSGASVGLRAAPVDGRLSYSRADVVLGRGATWQVP